jgi:xanthine dehydrogenase YagS FAD-binding subunit
MRTFTYERPRDVETALAAANGDTAFLGGGTNLVDLMRLEVVRPAGLIDINHLGLDGITETDDGGLRIGAGVRNSDLAAAPAVRRRYPAVSRALLAGATGQLRNLATTGGNLLQRTRCPYFQQVDKPCNKRAPGSGCSARDGDHRELAILGHSPACIATHPGDLSVALAVYDAEVELASARGHRTVPLVDFHRLPGDEPERDTVLEPGELITAVTLPSRPAGERCAFRKVRERASFAFALASVAVTLELADRRVRRARIALGAVAAKPWRARLAEEALTGTAVTAETVGAAIDRELAAAQPLPENEFKVPLVRRLVVRTLLDLAEGTR